MSIRCQQGLSGVHSDKSASNICKLRQWRSQQPSCLPYIVLDDRSRMQCHCTWEESPVVQFQQAATQILWFSKLVPRVSSFAFGSHALNKANLIVLKRTWDALLQIIASTKIQAPPSRPVLPFCPFWLHTFICLNSPELHCWLSSHPHCIKMMGLCFRVYVRRSQRAGTDPVKDSMPRAWPRGQGLPSDLPKDSLCLHLVVIDCKFVVRKVFGMTLPKTACPGHAIVS